MAEAERSNLAAANVSPARRSEELEALLMRIATHIDEDSQGPETASSSIPNLQPARNVGSSSAADPEAVKPLSPRRLDNPSSIERVRSPLAPPAAPIPNLPDRTWAAQSGSEGRLQTASLRRAQSALEPPALRSALSRMPRPFVVEPLAGHSGSESVEALREALREVAPRGQGERQPSGSEREVHTSADRGTHGFAGASPIDGLGPPQAASTPERAVGSPAQVDVAETARRIEAALETLAPREAVDRLGDRIAKLQAEVGQALGELKRLDGLEAQLGVLGTRLTDEQIVALFGPVVPTAEDLTRFAEEAAARTADRVLAAQAKTQPIESQLQSAADTSASREVAALGESLSAFMDERRRSDAGIHEALETLQLAMQHVLDQIEHAANPQAVQLPPDQKAIDARAEAWIGPQGMRNPSPGIGSDDVPLSAPVAANLDPTHSEPAAPVVDPMLDRPAFDRAGIDRDKSEPVSPAGVAIGQPYPRRSAPPVDQMRPTRYEAIASAPSASERQHRGMTPAARRSSEVPHSASGAHAPAKSRKASRPGPLASWLLRGNAGKSVAGVRPGVLIVVSLAASLLAGYWLMSSPKVWMSGSADPSSTERSESELAPSPNGEPARPDLVKPIRGEGVPQFAPSRIRSDEPPASASDIQEARVEAAPARAAGPGMSVVLAAEPMTIEGVIQARERARMASLSQRTGAAAAQPHSTPLDTSQVVTASLPAQTAPASAAGRQLALPPATAGPLSLRLAAAQGDASAQLEIATRLAEAKGVKQNFAEAALWYERAAAQGEAVAQYRLATLYERGMGVQPDRERARTLYRQAADQGNIKAMHDLAVMSASPAYGTPDYVTAASLFGKAAGHGLIDSQYNLAVLYQRGQGVPKDHAAAYRWFALAARSGDAQAAKARDFLIARLPAETIEASNAQIASWQPNEPNQRANDARLAGEAWKQRTADARR